MKTLGMFALLCALFVTLAGCCTGGSCFATHNPAVNVQDLPS
ncbi:MAG: hypothetical protein R3C10_11450 [Pirellulales bacterium]